jgi:hypothetical protein
MAGHQGHKMNARMKCGVAAGELLVRRPMHIGDRKVLRHNVPGLVCEHNGAVALCTHWSGGMARHPYRSFRIRKASPGDRVGFLRTEDRSEVDFIPSVVR